MRHRGQRFGFGRTGLAGGATIVIVVALLVGPGSGRAPAQDGAPSQRVVDDGRGLAGATVLSVAPATGGLELAVTSGQARAETTGGLAQALARSFSLGLIGSSLTAERCDGGEPLVDAATLPQALRVDNRNGPGREASTEIPVAAPVLGLGTENVAADDVPSAQASTTTGDAAISALLTLGGGRSYASSTVLPGDGREAEAGASIDVEIAGLVELTGMRWSARHRTGASPSAEAGFTIGGLTIGGAAIPLELPLESLEPIGALINAALAPLGFTVELPTVERITDPVDVIRITPLKLLIADTPASATVQAALDLTRDFRSQLFDAIVSADCSLGSALLVGDVVTGVASGTGALVLALGGAEATSGDIVEEDLFGDLGGPIDAGPPVLGRPGSSFSTPPPLLPSGRVASGAVERGPSERSCESSHPRGEPGCSTGAATVAGIVGAVTTAGVALLDLRRRRHHASQVTS